MANDDIERLAERLRTIESNLRRVLQSVNLEWAEPTPTDGVPPEVIELIRGGDTIGAAKTYRELTGASLGEAKDVVDKIAL